MDDLIVKFLDPSKLGVAVLLAGAVTAFLREWIIPGSTYTKILAERDAQITKLVTERDEFKRMLWSSIEITERTQRVRGTGLAPVEGPHP